MHEATSSARAKCRKARTAGLTTFFLILDADGKELASYLTKDEALFYISRRNITRPEVIAVTR